MCCVNTAPLKDSTQDNTTATHWASSFLFLFFNFWLVSGVHQQEATSFQVPPLFPLFHIGVMRVRETYNEGREVWRWGWISGGSLTPEEQAVVTRIRSEPPRGDASPLLVALRHEREGGNTRHELVG